MNKVSEPSEYVVVYEKTVTGYSAYVPDLPGCISTGATLQETKTSMQEAISGHLSVMREFGDAIPQPTTIAERMQIPA
ncbi:MAG TPA: type II toxin-antitoxin system HicB family antitoxin [Acidobacteriaceae bacterium]|nr:type II toxin-antitoxin system HicB family antitoxin [Acidobacteriaceae bacterium]